MQVKKIVIGLVVGAALVASVGPVQAAFFDRDKLAQALSARFNLNEREVSTFLAEFQYPSTATPVPTPTPTPTPAAAAKSKTGSIYDQGSDKYYLASQVVSVQHQNHLDFIETKLDSEVAKGKMKATLRDDILSKLAEEMEKSPSSDEFTQMGLVEQRAEIARFKRDMDAWLQGKGTTLAHLREITGKGNKYLMGIYFD